MKQSRFLERVAVALVASVTIFFSACGGNGTSSTSISSAAGLAGSATPQQPTISVSPTVTYVSRNTPVQFTATVTGSQNATVNWSAFGIGVSIPSPANVVDANGRFVSSDLGAYQVQARLSNNPAVAAQGYVLVLSVSAFPNPEFLLPGQQRHFTAVLSGIPPKPFMTFDTRLNWSIAEGAAGGTIDLAGNYTAPASLGAYHVVVNSVPGPSITTTIPVTVVAHGFHVLPSMITPRSGDHKSTLLADGRVLITGGYPESSRDATNMAEIFDPATNSFSATGGMTAARLLHSATLLNSGKVLIVGGINFTPNSTVSSTAELYDPGSGTFTRTGGSPSVTHVGHTATLLQDGKVLITGGQSLGFAEVYDPASDSFSLTAGRPIVSGSTYGSAALLPNGKVLYVADTDPAELFDPATGSFSPVVTNNPGLAPAVTVLPDGDALLLGANTQLYSLTANRIASTIQPQVPVFELAAAKMIDGRLLKSGGIVGTNVGAVAYAEIFDPATFSFTFTGSMVEPHASHVLTPLPDGRVLSTGGIPEVWQ